MTTPYLFLILSCVFQRVLELEVAAAEYHFIFIDEAGFNLTNRKEGKEYHWPTCHCWSHITMCAAITHHGIIHHHATHGPYKTAHLITFHIIPPAQSSSGTLSFGTTYVSTRLLWLVNGSLPTHAFKLFSLCILHSSILLRNFYLSEDGKCIWPKSTSTYTHSPNYGRPMWRYTAVDAFHGWSHHSRGYFPCWLATENIACDVDKVLWPDRNRIEDAALFCLLLFFLL